MFWFNAARWCVVLSCWLFLFMVWLFNCYLWFGCCDFVACGRLPGGFCGCCLVGGLVMV